MKKLLALLNAPARLVIVVGAVILVGEFLIMMLIESIHTTTLKVGFLGNVAWKFVDPIVLTAFVAPALYFLIFRALNQQAELEGQLDELHRFQKVTVRRELRMKELVEENTVLRNPLSAKPAGDIPVTSGSLEAPHHAAEQPAATQSTEESQHSALLFMLEDLEDARKKIEQAHQEWMAALDVVNDPIFLHDEQFRILRCNKAYQQRTGIPFKQIIGKPYYEVFPKTGAPLPYCLRVMEKAEAAAGEEEIVFGDVTFRSRTFSVYGEQGGYLFSVHILEDITERKLAENALREAKHELQEFFDLVPDMVCIASASDGCFQQVNKTWEIVLGFSPDELIGKPFIDFIHPDDLVSTLAEVERQLAGQRTVEFINCYRCKDGSYKWLEWVATPAMKNKLLYAAARDITERKRAEATIEHTNDALATLGAVNRALVRATDESELLQSICQAIVEQRGYRLAWVGYVQHDESKSIKFMAHAGPQGCLDAMLFTWAETERGMSPSGRAVRSGATQLCHDIANDPQYLPCREEALKCGIASKVALPLKNSVNAVFGILHVYAGEVNAFTPAEIDLLEEMAGDLAFGVRSLHTRHERDLALVKNQEQLVQLRNSLEDTVRAIATIGEMRDPYTSGHQVRVADLAAAIAKQMGMPDEQVHAIHLAGIVHDLGKIKIPAEILSKPGKITDIELSLIKVHPQAGYDILKDIDFPWPIAQMVLQHHERLDGSGYPQGLKGEAILLEARILAVADVVEAIFSHRPYRPGLGVEAALGEITHARGTHYDPQVVDACLALFREQGYLLPG